MSRAQDQIAHRDTGSFAGIDVGKAHLDLYITPANVKLRVPNTPAGIGKILLHCKEHGVQLAALEATGAYHRPVHEALHTAGIDASVLNPLRARQFAESSGQLAKTDTVDARILARFAQVLRPEPTPPLSQQHQELRALTAARRQVLQEIGDLKRQLQTTEHSLAARQIRARIKMAERHKAVLEAEARRLIAADPQMRKRHGILVSIPSIGDVTATILISELTELGRLNSKQIAALAGLAPMSRDSGTKQGNRMIRGGRQPVRNALYMCAVCCTSGSGTLGQFYRRLVKLGKHPKTALTAVMRKLVILANTLVAEDRCWQPERP